LEADATAFAGELSEAMKVDDTHATAVRPSSYELLCQCLQRGAGLFSNSLIGERCMFAFAAINSAIAVGDYLKAKDVIDVGVHALLANVRESLESATLFLTFFSSSPVSSENDDASQDGATAALVDEGEMI